MKQISLLLILSLSFSLGALAKSRSKPHLRTKSLACPVDASGSEVSRAPVHTFRLNPKAQVLICVPKTTLDENGQPKSKFITRYDAYLFEGKKPGKRVLSGSGTTPVRFQQRKGEIFEIMHLNLRGSYHELYKEKILCGKGLCQRKEKTCVFNQYHMSPMSPKEYEREKIIFAKGAAQVQEMSEADLAQMSSMALSGRKLAYEFFTELNPQPILLGSTVPFYQHMQGLLTQMKAEGCLKVQER